MRIKSFEFNFFGENTYIMWDDGSKEAAIVDPGMMNDEEMAVIGDLIDKNGLEPKYILLTHAHIDHTFGID
ncbi:MAG: MBL fold metallo-hydrolase, partial [Muribaculaceae bacterium]|nr:MBL fold metallo-hydrolase [Muribaculaceae bacterium]